jgi:hypothetical protein
MSDDRRMTKDERIEIAKFIRAREKVAVTSADHQGAALKADFESKLSVEYPSNHPTWAATTAIAEEAVEKANQRIKEACGELGIPARFAPAASRGWLSRGENMFKERRAELRKTRMGSTLSHRPHPPRSPAVKPSHRDV